MKLTDIQIDQYGVWRQLALPLRSAGLNVFYGPNEAGKTTLLHFIREILFRGQPRDFRGGASPQNWRGAVRLSQQDRYLEIRRNQSTTRNDVELHELDPALAWNMEPEWSTGDFESAELSGVKAEDAIQSLLPVNDEKLFRHVFAIGLPELQELATLEDEEVARVIYGLSLGVEGRQLLNVASQFENADSIWNSVPELKRRLRDLLQKDKALNAELSQFEQQSGNDEKLRDKQNAIEAEIAELQHKQTQAQQQLQGHNLLKRVWEPWQQIRECEAELRRLPAVQPMPKIDPKRKEEIENELRKLSKQRKSAIAEVRTLQVEIEAAENDRANPEHIAAIQGFLNQRGYVLQLEKDADVAAARVRERKTEFEARHQSLGKAWPLDRVLKVETHHDAYTRLVDAARNYQSTQTRQTTLRKRYDKYSASCHQRQSELDKQIEALPEDTLPEALEATRTQLTQVEDLSRLHLRENETEQRLAAQKRELGRLEERSRIPSWVPGFLLCLAVSSLILSAIGFYTGLTSNGITGAILGLVGIAGFAIARAFQLHAQGNVEEEAAAIQSAIHSLETSLRETRTAIKQTTPKEWLVSVTEAEIAEDPVETVLTTKLTNRLSELRRLEVRHRRLQSRRRRLSRMRKTLQARQRDVSEARQEWCSTLQKCHLPETLAVEEAFDLWRILGETQEQHTAWQAAREAAADVQSRHEEFCHRLADCGTRMGDRNLDFNKPLAVLDFWKTKLSTMMQSSPDVSRQQAELKDRKRHASRLKRQYLELKSERSILVGKMGSQSQEERLEQQRITERRQELEELLELAKMELATAEKIETELAIVEQDLIRFNAKDNEEAIELLQLELDDVKTQLAKTYEALGRLKEERDASERSRCSISLKFQLEQNAFQIRECLTQLAGWKLGVRAVEDLRTRYEVACQPEILDIASDYLSQLTCGKYSRIWTKLAEQRLQITTEDGQTRTVEQLSNGTREQLFLALRLGLVQEFANRGIRLPMVLDDVLVNFDQHRMEAAVQTLIEFADQGHQVLLFTSHLHLARFCETQGIDPVWLPAHRAVAESRRAG